MLRRVVTSTIQALVLMPLAVHECGRAAKKYNTRELECLDEQIVWTSSPRGFRLCGPTERQILRSKLPAELPNSHGTEDAETIPQTPLEPRFGHAQDACHKNELTENLSKATRRTGKHPGSSA